MPAPKHDTHKVIDHDRGIALADMSWMTGPVYCTSLGAWAAHMPDTSCDGQRLAASTTPATSADECNTACVTDKAVAWTWNAAASTCKCKSPPLSPVQASVGDVSGLACF